VCARGGEYHVQDLEGEVKQRVKVKRLELIFSFLGTSTCFVMLPSCDCVASTLTVVCTCATPMSCDRQYLPASML